MTFRDVDKLEYKDYMRIAETVKPYRGTKCFPIGDRRYSDRHFIVNDNKTVSIYYARIGWLEDKNEGETRTRREQFPAHATVHPDNTIEFHKVWDVVYLSRLTGKWICHRNEYGGAVIIDHFKGTVVPIFKGARFSLSDGECLTPYEWFHPTVNRKRAKEHLKRYDDLKKLHGMYLKAMDKYGLTGLFNDLEEEAGDKWENSNYFNFDKFNVMVDSMRHADAAVYISTHSRSWWWHKYTYIENPEKFVKGVEDFMRTGFDKCIYKHSGGEMFDYTLVPVGEKPKSSKWRIVIKSNGKVVVRL